MEKVFNPIEELDDYILENEIFTVKRRKEDKEDYHLDTICGAGELPSSFLLEDKYPLKMQFGRGSCTAQAYASHKADDEGIEISAMFAMANTKKLEGNNGYGAITVNQFKVGRDIGSCEESLYPEAPANMSWDEYIKTENIPQSCFENAKQHKLQSYWFANKSIEGFKQAIFQNKKSLVSSMNWLRCFNSVNSDGTLNTNQEQYYSVGGHAVDVRGWNELGLWVKNSFSKNWGKNGYFILQYSLFDKMMWEGIMDLDIPKIMPVDERYGKPRTWATFQLEKFNAFSNKWLLNKIKRTPSNRELSAIVYGGWDYESIFLARCGQVWLSYTKQQARDLKLINY